MILSKKRITKALAKLCVITGWSATLFANDQGKVFWRRFPGHIRAASANAKFCIHASSPELSLLAIIGYVVLIDKLICYVLVRSIYIQFVYIYLEPYKCVFVMWSFSYSNPGDQTTVDVDFMMNLVFAIIP